MDLEDPSDLVDTAILTRRAGDLGLLRPGLELALRVARTTAEDRPPIAPPPALRPFLRHAKLTPRARSVVREVVDSDGEFRMRVSEAAGRNEESLSAPARLWIDRPDGWERRLGDLVEERSRSVEEMAGQKEERRARRQADALGAALEERDRELAGQRQLGAEAEAGLVEQRRRRRDAEHRAEVLASELDELGSENMHLRSELVERRAVEKRLEEQLGALRSEIENYRTLAAASFAGPSDPTREPVTADKSAPLARETESEREIARSVATAASAAMQLGKALGTVAAQIESRVAEASTGVGRPPAEAGPMKPPSAAGPPPAPGPPPAAWSEFAARPRSSQRPSFAAVESKSEVATKRAATRRRSSGVFAEGGGGQRRPSPLPPAIFEDSVEAAIHLVRAGVLLIVDGYNVSLSAWPTLDLASQRQQTVDALTELAARSGALIQVIFDGAENEAFRPARGVVRTAVRIVFSEPGVDADEVIIETVERTSPERVIVVATDDRRVQDEVRRRGANVVGVGQLLSLLRRVAPQRRAGR